MSLAFKVREFENRDYWTSLCPELSVSDEVCFSSEPFSFDEKNILDGMACLKEEGHFSLRQVLPHPLTQILARCIRTLHAEGIPPIFCFLYDEFWEVVLRLSPVFSRIFGHSVWVLPDFWSFYVEKGRGNGGWSMHRDLKQPVSLENGLASALTFWVSLSHADTMNACMVVVPKYADPWFEKDLNQIEFKPEHARALPTDPGDILFWHPNLIHWGGPSSNFATEDRISFAFYIQSQNIPPLRTPIIDLYQPFSFSKRLGYIGQQIQFYHYRMNVPFSLQMRAKAWVRYLNLI